MTNVSDTIFFSFFFATMHFHILSSSKCEWINYYDFYMDHNSYQFYYTPNTLVAMDNCVLKRIELE